MTIIQELSELIEQRQLIKSHGGSAAEIDETVSDIQMRYLPYGPEIENTTVRVRPRSGVADRSIHHPS